MAETRFLVLHGPNLNLLGRREPGVYGTRSLADINAELLAWAQAHAVSLRIEQHNGEGELISALHRAAEGNRCDAVVLNPGAYTHTSVALRDAVAAIASMGVPTVEVHLSNIHARESFRRRTVTGGACLGVIAGFGADGYRMALEALLRPST